MRLAPPIERECVLHATNPGRVVHPRALREARRIISAIRYSQDEVRGHVIERP